MSDQKRAAKTKSADGDSKDAKKAKKEVTPAQLSGLRKACQKLEPSLDRRDASDAWNDARHPPAVPEPCTHRVVWTDILSN